MGESNSVITFKVGAHERQKSPVLIVKLHLQVARLFVWTGDGKVLDPDGVVVVADAHVEVAPTLALANAQALKAPCF